MPVTARLGVVALAVLAASVEAHAQALFTLPGDVRVVEVDDAGSPVLGTDKHGFVWAYGNGGIYCYDPSAVDGSGQPIMVRAYGAFDHPGIAQAQVWVDPSWDGAVSYEGLHTPNPDFEPGGPQLQFQSYACDAALALPAAARVPVSADPGYALGSDTAAWPSGDTFLRAGRLCAAQRFQVPGFRDPRPRGRVMCVDFPSGGAPVGSVLLGEDGLDARLGVPSWEASYPGVPKLIEYAYGGDSGQTYQGPPFEGWSFAAPVVTPEGRVFLIATRQTAVYANGSAGWQGGYGYPRWVLELAPDGQVTPTLSPDPILSTADGPVGLGLSWHAATGSLLVTPNGQFEFGNYIQCGPDGNGNLDCNPHGPGGVGFLYLAVDGPGFGYFSIRDALARAARCSHDDSHTACTLYGPNVIPDPAGRVILSFINREYNQPDALGGWKDVVDSPRRFRLDFDPSAFDMDGDGLTAADEALLGTSDDDDDSDDGLTFDAAEAGVLGTDPADASDDARPRDDLVERAESGYGTSRLVRAWLPQDVSDYADSRAPSLSPDGPLCFRGRCLDVHAHEVMSYPTGDTISDVTVSADASFVAWREGTAFRMKRFRAPGEEPTTFVQPGELERFIGAAPPLGRLFPISETLTYWVQTAAPPLIVAFDGDGKGSLVFDLMAAACDSELDACAPDPIDPSQVGATDALDALFPAIDVVGFAAATQRILFGVKTNWRQFFLAVAAGKAPVVLSALSVPRNYPDWFVPTGHGDAYVESEGGAGIMTPDLAFFAAHVAGLNVWQPRSARTYWGDVTLVQAYSGRSLGSELPQGALEAVWFPADIQPGETLGFSPYRAMLSRLGARGGAFDAWRQPEPDEHGVSGIDVAADLRLCAANPRAGRVREYLPISGRRAPSVTVAPDIAMPHAVDCAYGEDGALRVLVSDPPAVWVRAAGATTFEVDASVTVPAGPKRFVRGPSPPDHPARGFADIAGADDEAAGRVVTRAGVTVDIPKHSWNLRWNGVVVANLRSTVFFFANDPANVNFHNEVPGDVSMVERADGRIAFSVLGDAENEFPGPYLYDPRSGSVMRADEGNTDGRLLAVVPGGDAVDPWSGDRLGPPVPTSLLGPVAPPAPPAPTGGSAAPVAADPGCAGGAPAGSALAVALALLRAVTARRRARP
ncbi:MAG: hypothetical protein U1F43_25835 [Myxococcota bacterium]